MTGPHSDEAVGEQISRLLHDRVGLRAESALRGRLLRCIRDDATAQGHDLGMYLDTLHSDGQALQRLLNRVTVQETAFFRHPEHFDVVNDLVPTLAPAITIWSAGCANGQEAFSLAMLLQEHGVAGSVVATDISTTALQRTKQASYSARELTGLSPQRVARHLTRRGDTWTVNPEIRARVRVLHHNLLQPLPAEVAGCDIVFCRNVLIYFTNAHATAFLDRIADGCPTAALFLGAAESIWQLSAKFETVPAAGTFSYRLRSDTHSFLPHPGPAYPANPSRRNSEAETPTRPFIPSTGIHRHIQPVIAPAVPAAYRRVFDHRSAEPARAVTSTQELTAAGQRASAAGDVAAAVTAFRKCAYLAPQDPTAHLHLGLALDMAGDTRSARRAYAAARHTLVHGEPANAHDVTEGYTAADLLRLLNAKLEAHT